MDKDYRSKSVVVYIPELLVLVRLSFTVLEFESDRFGELQAAWACESSKNKSNAFALVGRVLRKFRNDFMSPLCPISEMYQFLTLSRRFWYEVRRMRS